MQDIIIAAAASWRVSHILLFENGPWRVFRRLRERLGVIYYSDSDDVATQKYEITVCIWCLSVWVAFIMRLLPAWVRRGFAVASGALFIDFASRRMREDG